MSDHLCKGQSTKITTNSNLTANFSDQQENIFERWVDAEQHGITGEEIDMDLLYHMRDIYDWLYAECSIRFNRESSRGAQFCWYNSYAVDAVRLV